MDFWLNRNPLHQTLNQTPVDHGFSYRTQSLQTLNHFNNSSNPLIRSYHPREDAKAVANTPADIKEYQNSYDYVLDMPGLKSGDVKVQVENGNVLVISGERKREEEREGEMKYVRNERRTGKLKRKFVLPDDANSEGVSAVCKDGVLTVTAEKLPNKKPRTIEVN